MNPNGIIPSLSNYEGENAFICALADLYADKRVYDILKYLKDFIQINYIGFGFDLEYYAQFCSKGDKQASYTYVETYENFEGKSIDIINTLSVANNRTSQPEEFIEKEFDFDIVKSYCKLENETLKFYSLYPEAIKSGKFSFTPHPEMTINKYKCNTTIRRIEKYKQRGFVFEGEYPQYIPAYRRLNLDSFLRRFTDFEVEMFNLVYPHIFERPCRNRYRQFIAVLLAVLKHYYADPIKGSRYITHFSREMGTDLFTSANALQSSTLRDLINRGYLPANPKDPIYENYRHFEGVEEYITTGKITTELYLKFFRLGGWPQNVIMPLSATNNDIQFVVDPDYDPESTSTVLPLDNDSETF